MEVNGGCSKQQDDRVCNCKGKRANALPFCASLDRRRIRVAMTDRFARLVSTPNLRNFAHNVVSITSRSVRRKVRDHHPQIGKLEIGICSGLHG